MFLQGKSQRLVPTSAGSRLLNNIVLNFGAQFFLLGLTFFTAPYIVNHLGAELFGVVVLVQTVAGFAGIASFGIGRALTKYISELYWMGDLKQINELFQTGWAVCILCGVAGIVLLIAPRDIIVGVFFRGLSESSGLTSFAIYVAAVGLFSSMLMEAIGAIPGAVQQFGVRNAIYVLMGVIASLGSVAVLAWGCSVRSVLIVNLVSNVIGVAAFVIVSRRLIPGLNLSPRLDQRAFAKLFAFSFPLLLSAISALIASRFDRLILAYYLPLAALAYYTLPYSLCEKLSLGVANVTSVVFPFASELHARGQPEKVQELYLRSTKILVLLTLPFTVILAAIPTPILGLWLGTEYAEQGAVSLSLLSAATFANAVSAVPTVTALGVGRAWIPANFALITSAINLGATLLLVPLYGIKGAALGLLLSQAGIVPLFVYSVNQTIGLSSWRFISEALLRPLLCAGVQFLVLYQFRFSMHNLLDLAVCCLLSISVFGACALFVALTQRERIATYRFVSARMPRF